MKRSGLMNANIEGIKRLRKIAIVGCVTKYELAGNYILGKRGYLKLSGIDTPWMKLEKFEERYKHYGIVFFTEKDHKEGPFYFTERASISNTNANAYAMWVNNGICSTKEWNVLKAEAMEGYLSGSSYIDYRTVGAPHTRLAFAESKKGFVEYDAECHYNGWLDDEYDDEDDEDYSGE